MNKETKKEKRTLNQNNAIHLWLEWFADRLQKEGITITEVLNVLSTKGLDIHPTKENLKEYVWKPIQKAMFKKESTKELSKGDGEIDKIVQVLTKFAAEEFKIQLPAFPNWEDLIDDTK